MAAVVGFESNFLRAAAAPRWRLPCLPALPWGTGSELAITGVCEVEGGSWESFVRPPPPQAFGLANMRERARAIQAQLNLRGTPGAGPTMETIVPHV